MSVTNTTSTQTQIELNNNMKRFIIKALENNGMLIIDAPFEIQDDFDSALAACSNTAYAFEYISPRLQNDVVIAKISIFKNIGMMKYAGDDIRDNENIVRRVLGINPMALGFASERLRDMEVSVLKAIYKDGATLKYASDRLKDDEHVVYEAVSSNPLAIKHSSARLRNNEEIVMTSISRHGWLLEEASQELRNKESVVREAFKCDPLSFKFASERLKEDAEFCLDLTKSSSQSTCKELLPLFSSKLRNDSSFMDKFSGGYFWDKIPLS